MSLIYEPKGKAREYSPLSCNIYNGCDHACTYCYVPKAAWREDANQHPRERKCFLPDLEEELEKKGAPTTQVLLSFMTDPYCHLDETTKTTRGVLELFLEHKVPTAILTKGGERALRDLDIMRQFGRLLRFGSTLTFVDDWQRSKWEPNACETGERLDVLKIMHDAGIKTWASIEPVIDPMESMAVMAASMEFVDEYKIGKVNHMPELEKTIDWAAFLTDAVDLMRSNNKPFYIKEDLRKFANIDFLRPEECDPDRFAVKA